MIQSTFVEKYAWISTQEFLLFNSQCYFTPGINLVALTVLIGRKLGGWRGIIASLAGMLLPSATVTCLLTVGYSLVQRNPVVQAVMRGVIPATAGLMLVVGLSTALPQLQAAREVGNIRLMISIVLILVGLAALLLLHLSVIIMLLGTALIAMLLFTPWRGQPAVASPDAHVEAVEKESEEVGND